MELFVAVEKFDLTNYYSAIYDETGYFYNTQGEAFESISSKLSNNGGNFFILCLDCSNLNIGNILTNYMYGRQSYPLKFKVKY